MLVVNIIGLGYSGTTILARWLSELEGALAVGESRIYMNRPLPGPERTESRCSCGRSMSECPLWGTGEGLEHAIDWASKNGFGVVIDSSKLPNPTYPQFNVYIKKDREDWLSSMRKRNSSLKFWPSYFLTRLRKMVGGHGWLPHFIRVMDWEARTREIEDHKIEGQILEVKYNDFVENPQLVRQKVAEMIGHNGRVDHESSHIAGSNRSKFGPLKIKQNL